MINLSPRECAFVICNSIIKAAKEKRRKITRFQLSLLSLTNISKRKVVDTYFLNALSSELLELGWCMVQLENTRYAFIKSSSVKSWLKLSSKLMQDDVDSLISLKKPYLEGKTKMAQKKYYSFLINLENSLNQKEYTEK